MGHRKAEILSNYDLDVVFCPRLDQLLAYIEGAGYRYLLELFPNGQNLVSIAKNGPKSIFERGWAEDTPEEAVTKALIWIKEQEG